MNIYDTANKLAKEIRETKEYKNYKRLKENIKANVAKKSKVEEFESLRYKTQVSQMQGTLVENDKKILQEEYAKLLEDEEIKKYFEAEMQFNVMVADVNKIIAEAVKDVL